MEQHVILCGLGLVGWRVLAALRQAGVKVVVIDNRCTPNDPRLGDARLVCGDCRQVDALKAAEIDTARGVLILTSSDLVSISTALMVRTLNPSVRVVVRMFNKQLIQRLGTAAQNMVALSTSALTAPLIGLIARTGQALGTFQLESGERQHVTEVKLEANSPLPGRRISEVASRYQVQVVAYQPAGGDIKFLHEVNSDAVLARGDRLVLLCTDERLDPLLAEIDPANQPELAWAGKIRRFARMAGRTIGEIELGVKICAIVLVTVIVFSTLVIRFGMKDDTLADAFYRTVSLMASGSDMGGRDLEPGTWQKVFVSVLRIVGAALTAAFTAILTNYLVRAQLGGVLEVRRIPDSGHVIVCGLGNVGFRVVEELLAQGEQVVVIERARDNVFIVPCRRLGAAVIVGDAALGQVLKQANAIGARAIVAATSNDLVNLEVALLAREIHPGHRVVVRLGDPNLAQTLREAADVRLALSISELAAPAFVAALYGDQVRCVFFVAGQLLAVVDLVVMAGGPLDGQPMRVAAIDYDFSPLSILGPDGKARENPREQTLGARDRLTCLLSLHDLKRLLRRDPGPRSFTVEVDECPLTARPSLAEMLRICQGLEAAQAEEAASRFPLLLQRGLTQGQARELLLVLGKDRIAASIRNGEANN